MPILTRFDLLCSGVLNFMEGYFKFPTKFLKDPNFKNSTVVQVLTLILSNADNLGNYSSTTLIISHKCKLDTQQVEDALMKLHESGTIKCVLSPPHVRVEIIDQDFLW